jgi:acetolactate synthase-1/2/3 large subunit
MNISLKTERTAHAFLELLSLRGVDYFFANAGTDFASIVEAFAWRSEHMKDRPCPIAIPHEIPLVGMAQGYYLATGRPQAVMVHVNVGTANSLGGLMSARSARTPILFFAGRTPITEEGSRASRTGHIHWGQESFDQAGPVREYVKWDYELRTPSQLETVVDRALTIAMTDPKGPVYISMPREVLYSPMEDVAFQAQPRYDLPTFHPDPSKVEEAADILVRARFPLIITSAIGSSPEGVRSLVDLAETGAIGVVPFNPEFMNFPVNHPSHLGFIPAPFFELADAILVVDCDVPWFPNISKPQESAKIIQAGIDPFCSTFPIRGFPSDLTLQGDPTRIIAEIAGAVAKHPDRRADVLEKRREQLGGMHDEIVKGWREAALKGAKSTPLSMDWVSHNLNRLLGEDKIVVNEFNTAIREQAEFGPGEFFGPPHCGYLGWGMGTALGIKLALPDRTVVAAVGDGTYMFSVPSACHYVCMANNLPLLFIIYNNRAWHAVRRATSYVHPDGIAAKTGQFALSELQNAGYEKICEAFGGYGEMVESPDQVGPALERAIHAVRHEKRQALLNVICQ